MNIKTAQVNKHIQINGFNPEYLDSVRQETTMSFNVKTSIMTVTTKRGDVILVPLNNIAWMRPDIEPIAAPSPPTKGVK